MQGIGADSWNVPGNVFYAECVSEDVYCTDRMSHTVLQTSSHLTLDGHFPSDADIHCVAVDISHMPGKNRLDISLAWEQIYKVDGPGGLSDCLLL